MNKNPISKGFTRPLDGISRENIKITDIRVTPLTYKPPAGSYVHECGPIVIVIS